MQPMKINAVNIQDAVTGVATGANHHPWNQQRTFQAIGSTSAGAGAATIIIEVSNNGTDFLTIGTITLTLATTASNDGFASDAPWRFVRSRVSAISGTGATVTVWMGA